MIKDVWVVMGYANRPDLTERSITQLLDTGKDFKLLLINNGSDEPVNIKPTVMSAGYSNLKRLVVLHNSENQGYLPMLRQSLEYVEEDDLLVFLHNDVLLWDENWDGYMRAVFNEYPELGLAGLFGAPGVAADGGRMFATSHMVGKEWGTEGQLHGSIMPHKSVKPACVLDSLCMIFRKKALDEVGIPGDWPPHHWSDRLFCTRFIEHNWKVAVLGLAFDHYGGGSGGETIDTFSQKWVYEHLGEWLGPVEANMRLYMYGLEIWNRDYADKLSLIADDWEYIWRMHRQ